VLVALSECLYLFPLYCSPCSTLRWFLVSSSLSKLIHMKNDVKSHTIIAYLTLVETCIIIRGSYIEADHESKWTANFF
jgi:hypothetical protein